MTFSPEYIKTRLGYNPETGEFFWKNCRHSKRNGTKAGTLGTRGYWQIAVDRKPLLAHRLAWCITHSVWPEHQIDHINGDRLDNRLVNLREVSSCLNQQNQRRAHKRSTTGLLGVSNTGKGYQALIRVENKSKYLGRFNSPEEAHEAYIQAKRQFHAGNTL